MIFPLRALLQRRGLPIVTLLLIAANIYFFLYELSFPIWLRDRFIEHYALVPDRIAPVTLLTSMFLHGGWLHLIGNMWFLWVFGSHIEDAMGPVKFAAFYLIGGVASAGVQFVISAGSPIPVIGASGAIAGIMGAFLMLYPRVRVVCLVFIVIFVTTIDLPAAFMLVYWFILQVLSGLGSLSSITQAQGVAWFAHVGGFLAGVFLTRVFQDNRRRYLY